MIDIRCITDCTPADCVLVVAPKYCICTEGDTVSTDAGGFKQQAPTDTSDAASRNPNLVTGASRIGGEATTRPGGYTGETDTLAGGAVAGRIPADPNATVTESGPRGEDVTLLGPGASDLTETLQTTETTIAGREGAALAPDALVAGHAARPSSA